jgi:hypothetical protein
MRLFNEESPQSGNPFVEWTTQFNTATVSLTAGTGFSFRIGGLVYYDLIDGKPAPSEDDTKRFELLDTTLYFPGAKTVFQFYDEVTKMPVNTIQYLDPATDRKYSHRFVYETGNNEVPKSETLLTIPTKVTEEDKYVIVGNPYMSHLDFAKFYAANNSKIKPMYHLLQSGTPPGFNTGSFISFVLSGETPAGVTTASTLTADSIAPMQSFIVETTAGYKSGDLVITKAMSTTDKNNAAHFALRSSGEQVALRIKVSRDNTATHAVVALSEKVHNEYDPNEDSRRIFSSLLANSPTVFTITDGKYLDINQMKQMPASLPLGISTAAKGLTQITFTGSRSLPQEYDYYLFDKQTSQKILIEENTSYGFNNTDGDQIGRFYILSELRGSTGINEVQGNIQIYASQGVVHILSPDGTEIDDVQIFNPNGSTRYHQTKTGRTHIEIPITDRNPVWIVKVTAGRATRTGKVIIKH